MAFIILERDTKSVIRKKNVYITGNRKDTLWIQRIAEEILELWDCKVYIDSGSQFDGEVEEHLFSLMEMNLVVMAVTKSFLMEDNPAREIEFKFIREKKIVVLPILIEEGLEPVFDTVCGDLHLLKKNNVDYKQKLKEYLNSVFGDDELYMSIEEVLTGKIFLSYRKKDRKNALQLLHLIHQFNDCRDFKIWYDDFLTLGEDYDEEIDYHLRESDIFLLAVTPNLLEEGNYVAETEYPRAIFLKKKIIPVELIPTDREALQRKYPELPKCINIREIQTLEKILVEAKQEFGLEPCSNSDKKDYLLGQAYLKGISVEINHEQGIALIKKAAENGFYQAVYQLGKIYYIGEGVERNLSEAQRWMEKDVELTKQSFDKEGGVQKGITLALALMNLSDCYYNLNNISAAKKILLQLAQVSNWLWKEGCVGTGSNPGNVWLRLGTICVDEGDYNGAIQFYNKSEDFLEKMYKLCETSQSTKIYAFVLAKQGELYKHFFELEENVSCLYKAIDYFEKAKIIQERLINAYKENEGISNLVSIYINLEYTYEKMLELQLNQNETLFYLEKLREHCWQVYQEREWLPVETMTFLYKYAVYTGTAGFLLEKQGQIEKARVFYTEAYHIHKDMCKVSGNDDDYYGLATVCMNLAVAGMKIPDKELLREAYNFLEMLCQKNPENEQYRRDRNGILHRLKIWPLNLN